jgi:large subunit ribosomal protein L32e
MVEFLRRTWSRYSKLGKRRKKKQVWRKPTGRDNKMREKRKGYPVVVQIGYKTKKNLRNLLKNKKPLIIYNIKDLEKIKNNEIGIIAKIGKKKKIQIANKAKELGIKLYNLNPEKFLKLNSEKKHLTESAVKSK